jgi:hypothetical protein
MPRTKTHTLFVERAIPIRDLLPSGLVPGDVVVIAEGEAEPLVLWRPKIALWRHVAGQRTNDVCRTIRLMIAQGALAAGLPELAPPILSALSQIEAQTASEAVEEPESPDVDAALARLAVGSDLPREERGATLAWLAIERERGCGDNDGEWHG